MPTAAKLVAALCFAAVAFFAAEMYKNAAPPETQWGRFTIIATAVGALIGWSVMGGLVGRGYYRAAGYGIRTSATIVFWLILGFSIYEMVLRSARRQYDGVFNAIEGTFDIILVNGATLLRPEPLIVLVIGGILGGMCAEWANRQWR
ncbi:MAG: TrgA family protein [Gemmobacter sp.]